MSASPTLAGRIDGLLRMCDGTMPAILLVEDEAEKQQALGLLQRRHGAKCIEVLTRAEDREMSDYLNRVERDGL